MKPSVGTSTRLELRIVGNRTIRVQGEDVVLKGNKDAAALVLITTMGRTLVSEEIVAVTCDVPAFLRLRAFAKEDGGITLAEDLG